MRNVAPGRSPAKRSISAATVESPGMAVSSASMRGTLHPHARRSKDSHAPRTPLLGGPSAASVLLRGRILARRDDFRPVHVLVRVRVRVPVRVRETVHAVFRVQYAYGWVAGVSPR